MVEHTDEKNADLKKGTPLASASKLLIAGSLAFTGTMGASFAAPDNTAQAAEGNTVPVLELSQTELTLDYGAEFNAAEYIASASDAEDGDNLIGNVTISGHDFDTEAPGEYAVTYTLEDTDGELVIETLNVQVFAQPAVFLVYDAYVLLDSDFEVSNVAQAFVYDTEGNLIDVSDDLEIEGTVDTSVAGDYDVTYSHEDADGNVAEKTITVTVGDDVEQALESIDAAEIAVQDDLDVLKAPHKEVAETLESAKGNVEDLEMLEADMADALNDLASDIDAGYEQQREALIVVVDEEVDAPEPVVDDAENTDDEEVVEPVPTVTEGDDDTVVEEEPATPAVDPDRVVVDEDGNEVGIGSPGEPYLDQDNETKEDVPDVNNTAVGTPVVEETVETPATDVVDNSDTPTSNFQPEVMPAIDAEANDADVEAVDDANTGTTDNTETDGDAELPAEGIELGAGSHVVGDSLDAGRYVVSNPNDGEFGSISIYGEKVGDDMAPLKYIEMISAPDVDQGLDELTIDVVDGDTFDISGTNSLLFTPTDAPTDGVNADGQSGDDATPTDGTGSETPGDGETTASGKDQQMLPDTGTGVAAGGIIAGLLGLAGSVFGIRKFFK